MNIETWVSPEVKSVLPDVLIEYLYSLICVEKTKPEEMYLFELTPRDINGNIAQNILHRNALRLVFGFIPVEVKISIRKVANLYQMQIA